jgi:ATP-binding cassette, subfamily B, bacterial
MFDDSHLNYNLSEENKFNKNRGFRYAIKMLYKYLKGSRLGMAVSFVFLLANSATVIIAPFIIGDITNKYVPTGDRDNLIKYTLVLAGIYLIGTIASYFQIRVMGKVGQSILFRVRSAIFQKIQSLPLQFFNSNKSGDLISRINNDTEKLNQTFSETLLRFTGDVVIIIGIGITMVALNQTLGIIAVLALVSMLILTGVSAGWIRSRNDKSLQKLGELSGEIQESLSNFKVTVVFNRRSYFRESFAQANEANRNAATWAGIANGFLAQFYNYAGSIASLLILVFGIQILIFDKISQGAAPEFGSLLTFILYSSAFFTPLRELGELFTQLQTGIASWTRILKILSLNTNLKKIEVSEQRFSEHLLKFNNVSFGYDKERMVLKDVNMELDSGKTYALVGPTGGGKSTAASLMARLYDATEGQIFLKGRDIRTYSSAELANIIGFILQEPFLFTGNLSDNIKYGNQEISNLSNDELLNKLKEKGLDGILERFNEGLTTEIKTGGENISLGQRQLIAFVRVLLRNPEILILDEATANIDTVTEKLLEEILNKLPKATTKVIIAHRLNTIENADQIFFISGGSIEKPINFNSALDLINASKSKS